MFFEQSNVVQTTHYIPKLTARSANTIPSALPCFSYFRTRNVAQVRSIKIPA